MPTLTIAIPTYNMSEWLAPALESCLWQTHKDIDILVVNDGSTDNSLAIAEAYAAQDSRIRIISQANKGLGATRQTGQNAAHGDFITWLDADDFLAPHAASNWLEAAQKTRAEMICANAVAFAHHSFNARRYFPHPAAQALHFDTAPRYWKSKVVWRWVFSLPMLQKHELHHPHFKLGQDVCFMYQALLRTNHFSQVEPAAYFFRQEHKASHPSVEVVVNHSLEHFHVVKRILLHETPDATPRIKPFIKYMNENYWRDIKKVAPRLVGEDAHWEDPILARGMELFAGLLPEWFRNAALSPELKEDPQFLPFADAMIAKDMAAAKGLLQKLKHTEKKGKDKKTPWHTLRHTVKSWFSPQAKQARHYLHALEANAAKRHAIPHPAPVAGAHATR